MDLFSELLDETLVRIEGLEEDSEEVVFKTKSGKVGRLFHKQDCCEYVRLVDVCGDPFDLLLHPILLAEEVSNGDDPKGWKWEEHCNDSHTWTFYKLSTIAGSVTLRWLGESNGYYSEGVTFEWDKEG